MLLRVSDANRLKFESNLADDLDWLTWHPEAAWVKANVTSSEPFRNTPEGEAARRRLGMQPIYAKGTDQLIGASLRRGDWLFIFLLTTAAKADLPDGGNSATEAIKDVLHELRTSDPHARDGRKILYAHALDRVLRNELFGWQVYDALTSTYVLVDAAGRVFDALAPNSKDEWTLIAFGAARARDDTSRRFMVKRLNKARGGDFPHTENSMPNGYRASAEPDGNGRWNLQPDENQRVVRRPEPDPRQRWKVQLVAELFDSTLPYTRIAQRAGAAGVTAKGTDELDVPLHELVDLTSAGKHLLSPRKIRAYMTGKLTWTETGQTPGQFSPGDGHQLTPRFPGDQYGEVTYIVNVGRPEDDGWDWGVPRSRWQRILQNRFLPDDFTPDGWSWDDEEWDWEQIEQACADQTRRRRAPTGRHAANQKLRPLSGVVSYADGTTRSALFAKTGVSDPERERYEWRVEQLVTAKRTKTGSLMAMTATSGLTMSSWFCRELHDVVADVLTEASLAFIDEHGCEPERLVPPPAPPAPRVDEHQRRVAEIERLRRDARTKRNDADGYSLKAARALNEGREADADRDTVKERELLAVAETLDAQARRLQEQLADDGADETPDTPDVHDFGPLAAVIGALRGPFAVGPADKALNGALRAAFRDSVRLREVDAATAELSGTVFLTRPDGRVREHHFIRQLGRSRMRRVVVTDDGKTVDQSRGQRDERNNALRDAFWHQGCSKTELLERARSSNEEYWLKQMTRNAPATVTQVVKEPTLLRGLVVHPRGLVRAVLASGRAQDADAWPGDGVLSGVTSDLAAVLHTAYSSSGLWAGRGAIDPAADGRLAVVSVLAALPDPTMPMRQDHLAELAGVAARNLAGLSSRITRVSGFTVPGSLIRPTGWEGSAASHLPPEMRTVALPPCPWTDCDSPVADGLCLLPEIVRGCDTTMLCRSCERPPTRNVRMLGYAELCVPLLTGQFVTCSTRGCQRDLGLGPGVLWRFDDEQAASQHEVCRVAAA